MRGTIAVALTAALAAILPGSPATAAPQTSRVSVDDAGAAANTGARKPWISADGRYVTFFSDAANLAPGSLVPPNALFVRDRLTGRTELLSRTTTGAAGSAQPDASQEGAHLSADGRYAAFDSNAGYLVPGDTNRSADVFVRDREAGATTRVSVSTSGEQANSDCTNAVISADGRYVTFTSAATNLAPTSPGGHFHVFLRDLVAGTTTRVTQNADGTEYDDTSLDAMPSADGRYVLFQSWASGLARPFGRDGTSGVFRKDMRTGTVVRVSVTPAGRAFEGTIRGSALSADGNVAVLRGQPGPGQPAGIWVRDIASGVTTLVSTSGSGSPALSPGGRYVAFSSQKGDGAPGAPAYPAIYIRDLQTGTVAVGSLTAGGVPVNGLTSTYAMSDTGVAFASPTEGVTSGPAGGRSQIYVRDL
jgi:Tol biopolymer transport system component